MLCYIDYLKNEVLNVDMGFKFFMAEITNGYAARVHTPHTYDIISSDIIRRWVYPLVPDNNFSLASNYSLVRGTNNGWYVYILHFIFYI